MANKNTNLSITISTIDRATAKIKAINDRLDAATKPARDFSKALSDLGEKSGLDAIFGGFKAVGGEILDVVEKVGLLGGTLAAAAVGGLVHLVDGFDELGKKAARLGVGVDFLAEMRYAAQRTGVPVDALDESLQTFSENLGQARAGTGRMAKFVGMVSPLLLQQLKAAKGNAAAFDLLAGAMAKVTDPAKAAALAQKTLGDSTLAPLFQQGAKGIAALREEYLGLAGSQAPAAAASEQTKTAMLKLGAATDGVKAALVTGLAPALTVIVDKLRVWLVDHQKDIAAWADKVGKWLPGAIDSFVDGLTNAYQQVKQFFSDAWDFIKPIVEKIQDAVDAVGGATRTIGATISAIGGSPLGVVHSLMPDVKAAPEQTPMGAVNAGINNVLGPAAAVQQAMRNVVTPPPAFDLPAQNPAAFLAPSGPVDDPFRRVVDNLRTLQATPQPVVVQQQAIAAQPQSAAVTVEFKNAPPGMRANVAPRSTADVRLNVGYQMSF